MKITKQNYRELGFTSKREADTPYLAIKIGNRLVATNVAISELGEHEDNDFPITLQEVIEDLYQQGREDLYAKMMEATECAMEKIANVSV